jgi:hypothetical protein
MLGVRGYRLVKEKMVEGCMEFHIALDREKICCPECGSKNVWQKGRHQRRFRSVPIGSKQTQIVLEVPRVHCHDCQCKNFMSLSFAKPHKRYTRFFERYVLDLLQSMTCQDVAKHLHMSWDTVRDIEKTRLKRDFAKPPLKGVTHIAIDEIAVQKGHKYLTVVMDLKSGRVIFVGDGKRAASPQLPSASIIRVTLFRLLVENEIERHGLLINTSDQRKRVCGNERQLNWDATPLRCQWHKVRPTSHQRRSRRCTISDVHGNV